MQRINIGYVFCELITKSEVAHKLHPAPKEETSSSNLIPEDESIKLSPIAKMRNPTAVISNPLLK